MAFDLKVFKTRALTAIIFGAVILVALLGGPQPFFIVFGIVVFIGAKEMVRLQLRLYKKESNEALSLMYSLACVIFYTYIAHANGFVFIKNFELTALVYLGPFIMLTLIWLGILAFKKPSNALLLCYAYIPFSMGAFANCYAINAKLPLALMVLIWVNDTMQYIVGANFGKHKMAPIISPKKTWEGTIGGSILCLVVAIIWGYFSNWFTIKHWIIIGLCASAIGTLGDLLESKLKRAAQIKDSGNFMPGHGGILDRFDSLLLAAPILYFILKYIFPL